MKNYLKDPYVRTAIGILILAIALVLFSALSAQAQTNAKGNVIANELYEVYIQDHNAMGCEVWNRYEIWEYYQNYWARVDDGFTLEAVWISQCSRDTLATLTIHGTPEKQKIRLDITLDGSDYEWGKRIPAVPKKEVAQKQVYNTESTEK